MSRILPTAHATFMLCVATILGNAAITMAASNLALCAQESRPNAPIIQKVTRSERTDGVWHGVFVKYEGKPKQKLTLKVSWDAQTPAEDGKGRATSKSQSVQTNAKGQGIWKMEVKGYPAGDMRASVTDEAGQTSDLSPVYEVPWIY